VGGGAGGEGEGERGLGVAGSSGGGSAAAAADHKPPLPLAAAEVFVPQVVGNSVVGRFALAMIVDDEDNDDYALL